MYRGINARARTEPRESENPDPRGQSNREPSQAAVDHLGSLDSPSQQREFADDGRKSKPDLSLTAAVSAPERPPLGTSPPRASRGTHSFFCRPDLGMETREIRLLSRSPRSVCHVIISTCAGETMIRSSPRPRSMPGRTAIRSSAGWRPRCSISNRGFDASAAIAISQPSDGRWRQR